jgi:hypothetical protein
MKACLLLTGLAVILGSARSVTLPQATEDSRAILLENERKKLDRTKNPEDRTESLMKIADIELEYVTEAVKSKDASKMHSSIDQYRQTVTSARNTMMNSGLDPYKKSAGYRNVELGLRKHVRILEDTAKQLSLEQRAPVEETIRTITKIREEFLRALFR